MNKHKGIASLLWITIIFSVVIVAGGLITWQMWPKEEAPTLPPIASPTPTTTPSPSPSPSPMPLENEHIKVGSPVVGQKISSPVVISGNSDTFEGNVRIKIKDDNGNVLANTFTMGGGYGEMKPFSTEVSYDSPSAQTGVIEVFEDSPKDGAEINKIIVSVIFQDYSDETADWKTYTNKEYGFEIKYPAECKIDEPEKFGNMAVGYSFLDGTSCGINLCINPEFVIESPQAGGCAPVDKESFEKGVDKKEEKKINNTLFTEYSWIGYGGMGSWTRCINGATQNSSKSYYIVFSTSIEGLGGLPDEFWTEAPYSFTEEGRAWILQKMLDEKKVKIFDQILSTFKFIE